MAGNIKANAKTFFAAALLLPLGFTDTAADSRGGDRPGQFDFYVLSLSWSPTFCARQSGSRNQEQCGTNKSFGFIVHGLWPQNERSFPESCDSDGQDRVPRALGEQLFDIMPSMGLIGHEWRRHGSCSGLSQRAYFSRLREAFQRIQIPADLATDDPVTLSADQIEDKFIAGNPGMSRRGIAASCNGNQLEEVRICLTKTLQFRDCVQIDRSGCRMSRITIPPAR
jgi:ribonuclease T2